MAMNFKVGDRVYTKSWEEARLLLSHYEMVSKGIWDSNYLITQGTVVGIGSTYIVVKSKELKYPTSYRPEELRKRGRWI